MTTFLALYHGENTNRACMIAVSLNPELIRQVAHTMLHESNARQFDDAAIEALEQGKRRALSLLIRLLQEGAPEC
jgi:hypothetical protein